MIISRTPLRMSFVGGGSDIPSFYKMHGGAVVSTSINKYIYINVNAKFDSGIRIAYSKTEEVSNIEEIEHKLVKASLQHLGIMGGIEITSIADIPLSPITSNTKTNISTVMSNSFGFGGNCSSLIFSK